MMTTGTRRLLVALAMVTLLAGSCSSDGSDGDAGAGGDDATSTTAAAEEGEGGATGETLERYADYETVSYDDPTHWVCRPDADDICDEDLDTTVIEADGSTSVEPFAVAEDPPVDCFYVYPTISRDETTYSDWEASPDEEGFVTQQQAARLGSTCRVFAPVYRQATLSALTARMAGEEPAADLEEGDPFADVLDAFRTYMAEDNDGRGVVLIGHSQGSGMLNELISTEIDPNDDVRDVLVGAYLAGSSVAVPEGELVGGDFENVPLCQTDDEVGCVTTWATFRDTAPPPAGSFFGRPRSGDGVAGCVNPAAVGGGPAPLDAYFPADASASILASLGTDGDAAWLAGPEGEAIDTPFVSLPGLVRGECATTDGFTYLSVTVDGDPADPRADDISGDLTPEWGLHLVDVNLVMGDIVARVEDQATTYGG